MPISFGKATRGPCLVRIDASTAHRRAGRPPPPSPGTRRACRRAAAPGRAPPRSRRLHASPALGWSSANRSSRSRAGAGGVSSTTRFTSSRSPGDKSGPGRVSRSNTTSSASVRFSRTWRCSSSVSVRDSSKQLGRAARSAWSPRCTPRSAARTSAEVDPSLVDQHHEPVELRADRRLEPFESRFLALDCLNFFRQRLEVDAAQVDRGGPVAYRRRAPIERSSTARSAVAHRPGPGASGVVSSRILSASADTVATRGAKDEARLCGFMAANSRSTSGPAARTPSSLLRVQQEVRGLQHALRAGPAPGPCRLDGPELDTDPAQNVIERQSLARSSSTSSSLVARRGPCHPPAP
jgi:hypothetical protein